MKCTDRKRALLALNENIKLIDEEERQSNKDRLLNRNENEETKLL
jgi:hypothetical protein